MVYSNIIISKQVPLFLFLLSLFIIPTMGSSQTPKSDAKKKENTPSPQEIKKWIAQLGDKAFKVRNIAQKNLTQSGSAAIGELGKNLSPEKSEIRTRVQTILIQIAVHGDKETLQRVKTLLSPIASAKEIADLDRQRFMNFLQDGIKKNTISADYTEGEISTLKFTIKSSISDAALVHLKDIKPLESLSLSNTKITDTGLIHLKDLKSLLSLELSNTTITNAGLVHLKEIKSLSGLDLSNTKITDAGLVHLKDLKKLIYLSLDNTKITDAGLVHLKTKSFVALTLRNTKITDAGLVKLKKLLPNCIIVK